MRNRPAFRAEALGLVLLAVILFLVLLLRWGKIIPWAAR